MLLAASGRIGDDIASNWVSLGIFSEAYARKGPRRRPNKQPYRIVFSNLPNKWLQSHCGHGAARLSWIRKSMGASRYVSFVNPIVVFSEKSSNTGFVLLYFGQFCSIPGAPFGFRVFAKWIRRSAMFPPPYMSGISEAWVCKRNPRVRCCIHTTRIEP